jgi:hypothetical protein
VRSKKKTKNMSSKRFELLAPTHISSYHVNTDTWSADPENFPKITHIDGPWVGAIFHRFTTFKQFIYNT